MHYYRTSDETSLATAIDEAVQDDGIDVINMSLEPGSGGFCDNATQNGVREAIEAATDAGVIAVVAGGNSGALPPCNINNYATFPDTLAVGGTNDASSLFALESVERNADASFGSISVTLRGGAVAQTRILDVATNYCHTLDAATGTNNYGPGDSCGTSFASPTIAGLVGLLMHWSANRGGLGGTLSSDPYSWRTLIALLADGRTSGGTELLNSISDQLGFGNVRFSNLDTSLGSGTWSLSRTTVLPGSQHEFSIGSAAAEPGTANGLKFVAIIDDNRYGDSPDITYRLVDKCPPGGGETVLRISTKHALKGRIRISNGEVNANLRNRCLWIRTNVNAAAGSVRLFTAYMLYTTARSGHDASIL